LGIRWSPDLGQSRKLLHYKSGVRYPDGWTPEENRAAWLYSRQPLPSSSTPGILQESDRSQTLPQQFSRWNLQYFHSAVGTASKKKLA
jgi:hypothetical protein